MKRLKCKKCGEPLSAKEEKEIFAEAEEYCPEIICDECVLMQDNLEEVPYDQHSDADSGL